MNTLQRPKSVVSLRTINPESECLSPKKARFRIVDVMEDYDEDVECHTFRVYLEEI